MHEDVDFRSTISRKDFEALATEKGIFAHAAGPLKSIVDSLADHDITLKDIEVVEAIGGATRVPGVKKALSEALGGRQLDLHLDADKAVAMGAGLFAANMSTTFRMRKFGAADALPYGIDYQVVGGVDDDEEKNNKIALFNRFDAYPSRSKVTIENVTANEYILKTFIAAVKSGDESKDNVKEELVVPPAWSSADVATFNVSGIDHFREKYNNREDGNVTVTFAMDPSGIFFVEKAQFEVIVTDMVEIPRPKKSKKMDDKKSKKNITIEEVETTAKATDETAATVSEDEKEEKEEEKEAAAPAEETTKEEEKKEEEEEKETDATDSESGKQEQAEEGEKESAEEEEKPAASEETKEGEEK